MFDFRRIVDFTEKDSADTQKVKQALVTAFHELFLDKYIFVKDTIHTFIYQSKLDLPTVFGMLISFGDKDLQSELSSYFHGGALTASVAALSERLSELTTNAFESFCKIFTFLLYTCTKTITLHNCIFCAVDGINFNVPTNQRDQLTYMQSGKKSTKGFKGYNQVHATILFDIFNHRILDGIFRTNRTKDERKAYLELTQRWSSLNLVIMIDRGFEGWLPLIQAQKSCYYIARVKDINSNGVLRALEIDRILRPDGTCHAKLYIKLVKSVRKIKKEDRNKLTEKAKGIYTIENIKIPGNVFDQLAKEIPGSDKEINITLTLTRYKYDIINGKDQFAVVMSFLPDEFTETEIINLTPFRWRIESSFRDLKHTIGAAYIHFVKPVHYLQEFWARFTTYNYISAIHAKITTALGVKKLKKSEDVIQIDSSYDDLRMRGFEVSHPFLTTGDIFSAGLYYNSCADFLASATVEVKYSHGGRKKKETTNPGSTADPAFTNVNVSGAQDQPVGDTIVQTGSDCIADVVNQFESEATTEIKKDNETVEGPEEKSKTDTQAITALNDNEDTKRTASAVISIEENEQTSPKDRSECILKNLHSVNTSDTNNEIINDSDQHSDSPATKSIDNDQTEVGGESFPGESGTPVTPNASANSMHQDAVADEETKQKNCKALRTHVRGRGSVSFRVVAHEFTDELREFVTETFIPYIYRQNRDPVALSLRFTNHEHDPGRRNKRLMRSQHFESAQYRPV